MPLLGGVTTTHPLVFNVQCSRSRFFLILGMKNDRVRDGQIPGVFSVKYYNTEVIISYVDKRCNR
jgi:hypothetical protein